MNDERVLDYIDKRLERLEAKVDVLISFRLILIGGSAVVSAFVSAFFAYLLK
jgi:hypothetical protein